MLLMATRAVVRKRYNTHEDTKKATGNTAVTIPDELKARIKEIVRGIFAKIDEDQVRPQPRLLCFVRSVGSTCSLLTHSANAERHDFAYRVQGWLWPPSGHMCLLQAILSPLPLVPRMQVLYASTLA